MSQIVIEKFVVGFGDYDDGTPGVRLEMCVSGGNLSEERPVEAAVALAHTILAHAATLEAVKVEEIDEIDKLLKRLRNGPTE